MWEALSIIGGIIMTLFLGRKMGKRKAIAEVEKIEAETSKTSVDTETVRLVNFQTAINVYREISTDLQRDIKDLKNELIAVKDELVEVRTELVDVRRENAALKIELVEVRKENSLLKEQIVKLEKTIKNHG